MAYTVLARRYRSATFDDLVGQNHIAQTLKKAIQSGRVAHAYLFCGTRGVGKTSAARILAKALNCQKSDGPTATPCLKCDNCLAIARGEAMDVVEIDAASNTQVDKTREVILDNAQYRPAHSRFKIYIIDEVHMLSKASFNALLKTMEEPPEHVKFILATTEPEKVLATILSRCQRFDFRNIPGREIADHLAEICKQEKIKADDDALLLVAKAGAGSMRDALSLLDRLLSVGEKHVTAQSIEQLLGLPRAQLIFDVAEAIGQGDVRSVLTQVDKMIQEGLSADTLIVSLVDHLRNLLVLRTCGADSKLVEVPNLSLAELDKQASQFDVVALTQDIVILEELRRQLRGAGAGRAMLDAALVRLTLAEQFASVQDLLSRVDGGAAAAPTAGVQKKKPEVADGVAAGRTAVAAALAALGGSVGAASADRLPASVRSPGFSLSGEEEKSSLKAGLRTNAQPPEHSALSTQHSALAPEPSVEPLSEPDIERIWPALLGMMSEKAHLHAALSLGRLVRFEEGQAVIGFPRTQETFTKLLSSNGRKEAIQEAFSKLLSRQVGVRFEVNEAPATPATAAAAPVPTSAAPGEPDEKPAARAPLAPAAPPPSTRPTPEQIQTLEQDPLIHALMQELGGNIVKITSEPAE